ncbi:13715_t:CDS:2, partial [Gigaspora rosea]
NNSGSWHRYDIAFAVNKSTLVISMTPIINKRRMPPEGLTPVSGIQTSSPIGIGMTKVCVSFTCRGDPTTKHEKK